MIDPSRVEFALEAFSRNGCKYRGYHFDFGCLNDEDDDDDWNEFLSVSNDDSRNDDSEENLDHFLKGMYKCRECNEYFFLRTTSIIVTSTMMPWRCHRHRHRHHTHSNLFFFCDDCAMKFDDMEDFGDDDKNPTTYEFDEQINSTLCTKYNAKKNAMEIQYTVAEKVFYLLKDTFLQNVKIDHCYHKSIDKSIRIGEPISLLNEPKCAEIVTSALYSYLDVCDLSGRVYSNQIPKQISFIKNGDDWIEKKRVCV